MTNRLQVAGAGVAELPVSRRLKALKLALAASIFAATMATTFALAGWGWVASGFTPATALVAAIVVASATALGFIPWAFGWLDPLFNLYRQGDRLVFGGYYRPWHRLRPFVAIAFFTTISIVSIFKSVEAFPLPRSLERVTIDAPAPKPGSLPVYFWDYATLINARALETIDLVLPYEKGLPRKLLPKIYFEDSKTHKLVLELHGKRPRAYAPARVTSLFDAPVARPRDWPLLWQLQKEAGLIADRMSVPTLYLLRVTHPTGTLAQQRVDGATAATQAIGVPWHSSNDGAGRIFFWSPDGAVFQAKCPAPCEMKDLLEQVRFPADPKGSRAERLLWTKERLRQLLASPAASSGLARAAHDGLLSLYLISLLSLDPRDPEAFFHLGKLTKNRETALSAIKYGRDLGLEAMKILELEASLGRFGD